MPCLQTVLCGVYLKLTLAESPATAKCLSPEEQQWLSAQKSHQEVWDGLFRTGQGGLAGHKWPCCRRLTAAVRIQAQPVGL